MDRIKIRPLALLMASALGLSAPLALAQTPPAPPARSAADRAKASLTPLLQQGMDALAAGQIPAAREAFLDALAIDSRNARALHGVGLCALLSKDLARARDAFERALAASPSPDRALVINAAAFNVATRNNMRAAKLARDYLAARPKELDEPIVNALGTALTRASAVERKNRFFIEFATFYEIINKRLESARPGYKRFGVTWYTSAEVDAKMTAFAAQQKQIDAAADQVALAEEKLIAAHAELSRQQALALRGEGLSNPYLVAAQTAVTAGVAAVDLAKKEIERVAGATERPAFPEQIATVALDDVATPPITPPVVVTAAKPDPVTPATAETPNKTDPPMGSTKPTEPKPGVAKLPGPRKPVIAVMGGNPHVAPAVAPAKRRVTQYAAAFAISAKHAVTSASAVDGATSLQLQTADGQTMTAKLLRKDEATGLAILQVEARALAPLALADSFAGGAITCAAYPTVDLFNPAAQLLTGTSAAPKEGAPWKVSLGTHPRLPGSPILSGKTVVGVCIARRDAERAHLPAIPLEALRTFVGSDAKVTGPSPDPASALLQVVATRDIGE